MIKELNNFHELHYFMVGNGGLCANDFERPPKLTHINEKFILSISDVLTFYKPLSGDYVGKYVRVTMSNDDIYCITEQSYNMLMEKLK